MQVAADLIVWRHGLTDYNVAGRVQGQVDISLSQAGRVQAEAAARGLAELRPGRIVASPLARAQATAQALVDLTGTLMETCEDLRERSFGAWEGLTRQEIEAGWPQEFRRWRAGQDPVGVGVETRADTAVRVGSAMARLAGHASGGPVVVVAHGAAITLGVTWLLDLDPSGWFGLRGLDNCHYARLRRVSRRPGWMLVAWNEAGTLAAGRADGGGGAGRGESASRPSSQGPTPQLASVRQVPESPFLL